MFCTNCGNEIDEKAEICPKCGVRNIQVNVVSPTTASMLSFFIPGVGQFYNREVWKGATFVIVIFILFVVTISLTLAKVKFGGSFGVMASVTGALWLIFWIYNIYDAYKTAKKINFQIKENKKRE